MVWYWPTQGTSTEIIDELNMVINAGLADHLKGQLTDLGSAPLSGSPAEKADLRSELVRLAARQIVEAGLEGEAADVLCARTVHARYRSAVWRRARPIAVEPHGGERDFVRRVEGGPYRAGRNCVDANAAIDEMRRERAGEGMNSTFVVE